jgi:hypothetical protein
MTELVTRESALEALDYVERNNSVGRKRDAILVILKAAKSTDTERLDFMEKHLLREASMRFSDGSFKAVNAWSIASAGTDLRQAIDAARSGS